MILIICGYNLYEAYRIKADVPKQYHESQDILIVFNIIGIIIAAILLIGYFFARDKSEESLLNIKEAIQIDQIKKSLGGFEVDRVPNIELPALQPMDTLPTSIPIISISPCPGTFGRKQSIDINRL
jgi:hypothetical protein